MSGFRKIAYEKVIGMDITFSVETTDCVTCVESKQTKLCSDRTLTKDIVHDNVYTDIIGPFRLRSTKGSSFIAYFMVEVSRYTKICFV